MKYTILLCSVLLLFSCSKHESQELPLVTNKIQGIKVDENEILTFISKANGSTNGSLLKSETYYSIAEAYNYIGSALNYTYTFPTAVQPCIKFFSVEIELPVSQDFKISESDLLAGYNNLIIDLRANYRQVSET